MEEKATKTYATSFAKAFRPFYFTCKFLGLANFSWNEKTKKFETTLINHFFVCIFVLLWIAASASMLFFNYGYKSGINTNFIDGNYLNLYIAQALCVAVLILFQHLKRQNIIKFINRMEQFDEKLLFNKWKFQVTNSSSFMIIIYAFAALVILLAALYDKFDLNFNPIEKFKQFSNLMCSFDILFFFILNFQFLLSSCCILSRLKVLRKNAK